MTDSLQRISVHEVTSEEFIERWHGDYVISSTSLGNPVHCSAKACFAQLIVRFEKPYLPVVLTGDQDDWQARHKWTLKRLAKK